MSATREFKSLSSKRPALTALFLVLVPLLVALAGVWIFASTSTEGISATVALVNLDEGTELDGEQINYGDKLVNTLKHENYGFHWKITDAEDAKNGLRSNEYALSCTIPEDFSRKIVSIGSGNEFDESVSIRVRYNEAAGYIANEYSKQMWAEAEDNIQSQISKMYISNLFSEFNKNTDIVADLAEDSNSVARNTMMADTAFGALMSGLSSMGSSFGSMGEGMSQLSEAGHLLDQGVNGISELASGLSGGLDQVAEVVNGLKETNQVMGSYLEGSGASNAGTSAAATNIAQMAQQLASDLDEISTTIGDADESSSLLGRIESAKSDLSTISSAADSISSNANTTLGEVSEIRALLDPEDSDDQQISGHLDNIESSQSSILSQASSISSAASNASSELASIGTTLTDIATKIGTSEDTDQTHMIPLANAIVAGANGIQTIVENNNAALQGAGMSYAIMSGTLDGVSTGLEGAGDGVAAMSDAMNQMTQLSGGIASALDGIAASTSGMGDIGGQLGSASSMIGSFLSTAHEEAMELEDAIKDAERDMKGYEQILDDGSALDSVSVSAVWNTSFADRSAAGLPLFLAIALWIGAMLTAMLREPVERRFLSTRASARKVALGGLIPYALIAIVQALIVSVVSALAFAGNPATILPLFALSLIASICFVAIMQFLRLSCGMLGMAIAAVLLALQIFCCGFFATPDALFNFADALNTVMPLGYFVNGAAQIIASGNMAIAWGSIIAGLVMAIIAIVLTVLVAKYKGSLSKRALK
ncbi:MAG: YhgE/Pip family protein [Coriobacteriales bacterium]|nr:YhgE/Pip family protein [Coriobacteriales bacterium]